MPVILKIDTSDNKKIDISVFQNGEIKNKIIVPSDNLKSESTISVIDRVLNKSKLRIEDVSALEVNVIAGSYTGIRVGAAIANTLGFLLTIPINGEKIGVFAKPSYNE